MAGGKKKLPQKQAKSSPADRLKPYQWKKGQSGNPGGLKKGTVSLLSLVKRKLAEHPERASAIVENWLAMCEDNDDKGLRALMQLVDRVDGTPTKVVEHQITDTTGSGTRIILNPGNDPLPEEPNGGEDGKE